MAPPDARRDIESARRMDIRHLTGKNQKYYSHKNDFKSGKNKGQFSDVENSGNVKGSFASVLKGETQKQTLHDHAKPALVLDDSCLKERDFRLSLMGQVKEVSSIPNLHIILAKEGSWFSTIKAACNSFVSDERIVWISIEGLPINSWTTNTFCKVASKWGELVVWEESEENSFSFYWIRAKELQAWIPKLHSDNDDSSSENNSTIPDEECKFGDYEKETPIVDPDVKQESPHSNDLFDIYELLEHKKEDLPQSEYSDFTYPPGFTPNIEKWTNSPKDHVKSNPSMKCFTSNNVKALSHRINIIPTAGVSFLEVMDNLVQAKNRWIQELCSKNKINFVALQETKSGSIDLFSSKALWGNLSFDHAISPSELTEKHDLWDYLRSMIDRWNGKTVILGDFNEVRSNHERFGSSFNTHGANIFNNFISMAGLIDLPLGGYSFTWTHKSASKMSKLDRFLISEGLLVLFHQLTGLCVDKHLSDHCPIIMHESNMDYGPSPFRLFHSWFKIEGFDKFVEDTWRFMNTTDLNGLIRIKKKLQFLKNVINPWVKDNKKKINKAKTSIQRKLNYMDKIIDQGGGNEEVLNQRTYLMKDLNNINSSDENSKYFHGILNSKRSKLAIRGFLLDGDWIVDPKRVKTEFYNHFANQFLKPRYTQVKLEFKFPNQLNSEQDIVGAVHEFFASSQFPPGCNSTFITLIPKTHDAKVVKDFCPISLIGSIYKIIEKIRANHLSFIISDLVSDVQTAFVFNRQILDGSFILNDLISWCKHKKIKAMIFMVDFEKAFDFVRWDYLDDVLKSFGFGVKWRSWISGCLDSAKDSILINGSP
nr:RNA-directed DNA polymerase, eukaryota [Tanacetum cinerariifolium]